MSLDIKNKNDFNTFVNGLTQSTDEEIQKYIAYKSHVYNLINAYFCCNINNPRLLSEKTLKVNVALLTQDDLTTLQTGLTDKGYTVNIVDDIMTISAL